MSRQIDRLTRIIRRQWALSLAVALLLGLVLGIPLAGNGAPAPYADPRLECRRTVAAGDRMNVLGTRFPGGAVVTVSFDGVRLAEATTGRQGAFRIRITVPPTASRGTHTFTGATAGDGATASCSVRVRR